MNGTLLVFGFPGKDHLVHFTDQFTVTIENGCLIGHTGPAQFETAAADRWAAIPPRRGDAAG